MIPRVVLVEVSKVYKRWCNLFLRRMIGSELAKKAVALRLVGEDPNQFCMDHHWRASILESCRDLMTTDRKSTRLNSSHSGESRMPSSA